MGLYKFTVKNNMTVGVRIFAAVIVFVLTLIVSLSILVPPARIYFEKYIPQKDDMIAKISPDEIVYLNGCIISPNGDVSITGNDAHIAFSGFEKQVQVVQINFKEPSLNEFYALLYYDNGKEFNETNSTRKFVKKGDTEVCFKIPATVNKNIRVDIDYSYTIDNIELHSKAPDVINTKLPFSAKRCVLAVLISAFIGICAFFVDKYIFPFSEKILNYYKKNYKVIFVTLLLLLAGVLISVGIEYLLGRFVFGMSSMDTYFNMYRYFFVVCVVWAIILLGCHIKRKNQNPEKLFAFLMLLVGVSMILCAPFGHICWDLDSHSKFVFEQAYIGNGYITAADETIFYNKGFEHTLESAANNMANIESVNKAGDIAVGIYADNKNLISHIPSGVAFAVSRFLGCAYVTATIFGRMANLAVYVLLSYIAMKKLKSGKMILATIAFFPTSIYIATNYSYDFWVTAFIFVGVAYFMSELQQPLKPISAYDTFLMCGAFILACIPKQIYMPIMILPFFMYKKWKDISAKKRYYLICIAMFIFMFVLLIIRSQKSITGGGDMRGGSGVNSMKQLEFILSKPLNYTKILLMFLKDYLSIPGMKKYIVNFAYMGYGSGAWIFIAMLMFTTLTDKCANDRFKKLNTVRIISILLFFALVCLVATSLYIAFTEVGNEKIVGCQPRYIIPLLLPLLVIVASPGIRLKVKKEVYNTVLLSAASMTAFYNVATVLLKNLM